MGFQKKLRTRRFFRPPWLPGRGGGGGAPGGGGGGKGGAGGAACLEESEAVADVLVLPSLLLSASNVVDGTLIISIARFNVHITIESFKKDL